MKSYSEMITPFTRAISVHVHGDLGTDALPCRPCYHMEPCQQRNALVDLMDMAVQRWLESLASEPLGLGGQLLGPVTVVILSTGLDRHGAEQEHTRPGETRS